MNIEGFEWDQTGLEGTLNKILHAGPKAGSTTIPASQIGTLMLLAISLARGVELRKEVKAAKLKLVNAQRIARERNAAAKAKQTRKRKPRDVDRAYWVAFQETKVGFLHKDDRFVHESAFDDLPEPMLVAIESAKLRVEEKLEDRPRFNVARFKPKGGVTLMNFPRFFHDGVPRLREAWVWSPSGRVEYIDYQKKPVVILRKAELLKEGHRYRRQSAKLTEDLKKEDLLYNELLKSEESWTKKLEKKGYRIDGHELFDIELDMRARTAVARQSMSMPLRIAIEEDVVRSPALDWGSGRGADADALKDMGLEVSFYDPYYAPRRPRGHAYAYAQSVYVLNVINDPKERLTVLEELWDRTKTDGHIMVATRSLRSIRKEAKQSAWKRDGDGYRTGSGTFQKGFRPEELEKLIEGMGFTIRSVFEQGGSVVVLAEKAQSRG